MLEGLEDVPWHDLQHAYGEADDVPALIRALASGEASTREQALWELYGNIWHQHTVYEATAPAVPFLAEIALSSDVPDDTRARVTMLLADIADGRSYMEVHEPLFSDMDFDPGFQPGQLEREREWVERARDAVREVLVPLAADLDPAAPRERCAAAVYLAAMFPEDADRLVPRLRAVHDAAPDERLGRGAELALSLLGERPIQGFEVVGTEDRGRPVLAVEQDGERVETLASTVLSDLLFGEQ